MTRQDIPVTTPGQRKAIENLRRDIGKTCHRFSLMLTKNGNLCVMKPGSVRDYQLFNDGTYKEL